jgi:acyl carrier protein
MDRDEQRLSNCFGAVFPDLSERDIPKASTKSVGAWDSVATITLVSVIEEEFGLRFSPEQLDRFTSYESILRQLRAAQRVSAEA